MANKSFNRGTGPQGAEASMVYLGNTSHNVSYMLKHENLFMDLPETYRNSDGQAILDRLHWFLPGWEMENLRSEMFSDGYGFVVDYLAEILRSLRNHDYSDRYQNYFTLSSDISTRDQDGINKTFSGLMKMLFPHGGESKEEIEELLKFSIEGRKRVKDQLMRIDSTYAKVNFAYVDTDGKEKTVTTLEEEEYPNYYHKTIAEDEDEATEDENSASKNGEEGKSVLVDSSPEEKHITYQENQRGVSYDMLFGSYLKAANSVTITDPYIRLFYQTRNLMELIETIVKFSPEEDEVAVHLITVEDEFKGDQQQDNLEKIKDSCASVGIKFSWEFDRSEGIHARHIVTDHGWKILLDRGLDIFQRYEMNETFNFANRLQQYRPCKAFEVTFIKNKLGSRN